MQKRTTICVLSCLLLPAIFLGRPQRIICATTHSFNAAASVDPSRDQALTGSKAVIFDDSAPDRMRLSNSIYILSLSKTNGAILEIVDRSSGRNLTLGSRGGCLWGSLFPGDQYVGGCFYSTAGQNLFTYAWAPADATLTLNYTWDPNDSQHLDASVIVTPSDSGFFDLRLSIRNGFKSELKSVLFPSDILFSDSDVQFGYGTFALPGIRINRKFFTENGSYVKPYPGAEAFADYLALDIAGSRFAFYSVNPAPNPIYPVQIGFLDDERRPDAFYTYHRFTTWVENGKSWWSPTIRVWIGQTPEQSIAAYRQDNRIDSYPSIKDKIRDARFNTLTNAPLLKIDLVQTQKTFLDWPAALKGLPPLLIHFVAFQPGGHDENYPDFLPPDPQWGTTADMSAANEALQSQGHRIMPYTNYTWWNFSSPTSRNLPFPLTFADIAARGEDGWPIVESYGFHDGYVVSPYHPFVQKRLAELMNQWESEAPVDCIFIDQIGARHLKYDLNPAAPNPTSYSDGWQAFAEQYAHRCVMTEFGYDRLARAVAGFHGNIFTPFITGDINRLIGAGNWKPYPLANWMLYDKVLFYQHDLYDGNDHLNGAKSVLTSNAAFGLMFAYRWGPPSYDPNTDPRLDFVIGLQRAVAARYAGHPLLSYADLTDDVTCTTFNNMSVIANWNTTQSYLTQGYRIAPQGFIARSSDGNVIAGIFDTTFNNNDLSPGEHYLITQRSGDSVSVRQPIGGDTDLTIDAPGEPLSVVAVDRTDQQIGGEVNFIVAGQRVTFTYRPYWNNRSVAYYLIKTAPKN